MKSLQNTKYSIDEKLEKSFISLFGKKPNMLSDIRSDLGEVDGSSEHVEIMKPVEQTQSATEALDDGSDDDNDFGDGLDSLDGERTLRADPVTGTSDDSSDEEHDIGSDKQPPSSNKFMEQIDFHEGRRRRRAVFGDESDDDAKVTLLYVCLSNWIMEDWLLFYQFESFKIHH